MKQILIITWLACTFHFSIAQKKEVNFYLAPSLSVELIDKKGLIIKNYLEKETGLSIKVIVPDSYEALTERLGKDPNGFGFLNGQSYVIANKKYGATVKLRAIRFGHSTYAGQIVVRANSGIKSMADLNGKSMAYTDELSTSGYLYPKKIIEKNKVKLSKEVFAKKHDEVIRMVYEGKVDVGAAFYSPPGPDGKIRDARARVMDQYPDVEKKVIKLILTDPIPNDPIVFSKNFDEESSRKLYIALMKMAKDPEGKQALQDLYGCEGFVKAGDTDYNSLRQVMGNF
ncbi:MAG: phosphate/phosphite/phosphonate ABC transporter substrate-binding protein [Azospira oryzae]|jgi:phosphonate transport system substrate-binding protein|nr:MAG: phosphate/phosphite/phosphonate ABC transporter substrate-binding protein [Azospira oryzae]